MTYQIEDKLLGLFATGGILTIIAQVLTANTDPRVSAVGGLLVAVGGVLKAFVKSSQPVPPIFIPPALAVQGATLFTAIKVVLQAEIAKLPTADQQIANTAIAVLEQTLQKASVPPVAGA
jgi:hypothetical protein